MYPAAFTLVSTEDPAKIVAFGLEVLAEGAVSQGAITYRRVPGQERAVVGQHGSVEDAVRLYGRLTPVTVVWAT